MFGETFACRLSPNTSRLRFLVFDKDKLSADDPLGEVSIQVADCGRGPVWHELEPTGGCPCAGAVGRGVLGGRL